MANYTLAFHPLVQEEVRDAYLFYESRKTGLGDEFIDALDQHLHLISDNPNLFAVDFKEVRKAPLKRFPFSVYYEIYEDEIFVYSVFHQSRKPKDWKERTQ